MCRKRKVVIFSGAGISAESGLNTFRDSDGLWEKYKIEDVATPEAWSKNPELVTAFYNMRRKQCYEAKPNLAHFAILRLENVYDVHIITQNVDDLHERAGSNRVIHLHGELNKVKSSGPNAERQYYFQKDWEVKMGDLCPEGYQLRPHVVWFGEAVPMIDNAIDTIQDADIVVVVGTSLNVYPAAGIIHYAPSTACFYLIDPNPVSAPKNFKVVKEVASVGMQIVVEELIERRNVKSI